MLRWTASHARPPRPPSHSRLDELPIHIPSSRHSSKGTYTSKSVVVATGFYDLPNLLNIPGESLAKVSHYYKDPHYYAGMNLVVIGASNSSVDAALECYRKGATVTMVVRDSKIGDT